MLSLEQSITSDLTNAICLLSPRQLSQLKDCFINTKLVKTVKVDGRIRGVFYCVIEGKIAYVHACIYKFMRLEDLTEGLRYYTKYMIDLGADKVNCTFKRSSLLQATMECCKFKLEGCLRKEFNGNDDTLVYGVLKEEVSAWDNQPPHPQK